LVGHVTRLSSERTSLRNPKRRFFAGFFSGAFSTFFSTAFAEAFACLPPSTAASLFSAFLKNRFLGASVAAASASAFLFALAAASSFSACSLRAARAADAFARCVFDFFAI